MRPLNEPDEEIVREWVEQHAQQLPLDGRDVLPRLPTATAGAVVVGLAASVRSARELVLASHLLLRTLVIRSGFRAISIEGSAATGQALDRYVTDGLGEPEEPVASSQSFLRTRETLDLVHWLRTFNLDHPHDAVRIVHDHDHDAPSHDDREHLEQELARTILEWHATTGTRIVHLGGAAHTIVGDPCTVSPYSDEAHRNAGARLRSTLGRGYQAIAMTCGAGDATFPVPAPPPQFTESVFGGARAFLLDLHVATPPREVTQWLRSPLRTRCIGPTYDPARDADFYLAAGPLGTTVDAVVHTERITPITPL